jgi:hypothetical protein
MNQGLLDLALGEGKEVEGIWYQKGPGKIGLSPPDLSF